VGPRRETGVSYNLLEERWIPVLGTDGKAGREGIKAALTQAGTIRQIAASNPMDNVSLLRLLLAVLQWCKPKVRKEELDTLRGGGSGGVPQDWLKKLERNRGRFELLGDGPRFYQAASEAKERPRWEVSVLFADLPGGTEIEHFRHVYDRAVALCPACCALGLAGLPASATAGGSGLSPSINNAPPIYFVPAGETLLQTLVLNWPMQRQPNDHPAWEGGEGSGTTIGVLEGLTWQPRAVWLGTPTDRPEQTCARCRATGFLVSGMVFKKGRKRADDTRDWRDPHVAWDDGLDRDDKALRPPNPLRYSRRAAIFWRDEARAILESLNPPSDGPPVAAVAHAIHRLPERSPLRICCFKPATKPGQKKWFDEDGETWRISHGLLRNTELRARALAELEWVGRLDVRWMLQRALPREADQVNAALTNAAAGTEQLLRKRFEQLLAALGEADGHDEARRCTQDWRERVESVLRDELDEACAVVAVGSPLRRREAARRAQWALGQAMKRLAADEAEPSSGDAPGKSRRRQEKGGES